MIGSRRSGKINYAFATGSIKLELAYVFRCSECFIEQRMDSWLIYADGEVIFHYGDVVVRDLDDELYIYSEESFNKLYITE